MNLILKAIWKEDEAEIILTEATDWEEFEQGLQRFIQRLRDQK